MMGRMKNLAIERHNRMKRFVAVFDVQNGESEYDIIIKTEAETLEEAKKWFENYITSADKVGFPDTWKLRSITEVKTFEELWNLVRG